MRKISHSRNSVLTLLSWMIPLGLTFFATPLIVHGLGNEQYGVYALIIGFIAYSFTFNTGRALTKYVAEFSSRGEIVKIPNIVSATFFLSLAIATIGCLILVLTSEILVDKVFLINSALREETISGLRVAALCIWLTIIGQVFIAIVQGKHRFDVSSLLSTVTNSVLILGNIFLVLRGYGFLSLIIWNAATLFLNAVIFFFTAKRLEPETKINFKFDREMFITSLKYGMSVAGHQIFGNIMLLFERTLITRSEGPDKMTNYVVPMTISIYILIFVSNLTQNLMPVTSELFAQKNYESLELIYRRLTKIVSAIVVFMCLFLAVGSYDLLANWINPTFAEASYVVFIFQIISFGLMAAMIISWQFIEGFGLPVYNTLSAFSWMLISLPLMYFLTKSHSIQGTALARLLGETTIPFLILLVEKKVFGKLLLDLWAKILVFLGISGLLIGFIEYEILKNLPVTWLSLFIALPVCGILYLLILWLARYFSKDEQLWLASHIKRIFT